MKVVLFCGGAGMRIREYSEVIPKPMVNVGSRPMLWNVMKFYAHFGHRDFILCLGYKAEVIKEYFLAYNEALSNDFVIKDGGRTVHVLNKDIEDWSITFADTGLTSNIGQRLCGVRKYLEGEEVFLANYTDGLTDLPLDRVIDHFTKKGKIAGFVSVKPSQSFDIVLTSDSDHVVGLQHITRSGIWVNGGYFTFRKEIFDFIKEGEELVYAPFNRLIERGELVQYRHDGFFISMDTFKEKQVIDDMCARGETPWEVWKSSPNPTSRNAGLSHASAKPGR